MDIDPDKLTPDLLDKIPEHLMTNKALTGKPAGMGEAARRRPEADLVAEPASRVMSTALDNAYRSAG
ncbi:MAG TPA: hypothetical protein VGP62_06785 [Bryobacteraceae bacterium]|jgi:hypothetical protein|nr:hypothetical protein [Bryobacteraceae bacterium]